MSERVLLLFASMLLASVAAAAPCPPLEAKETGRVTASVRDFGAHGTGVSDDTCAVLHAIEATQPGGTLLIPRGLYRLTQPVIVNKPLDIVGQGFFDGHGAWRGAKDADIPALWTKGFDGSVLWLTNGARLQLPSATVNLRDLMLIGNEASTALVAGTAGQPPVLQARWQNIRIVRASCGIELAGLAQSRFDRLQVRGADIGLRVLADSDDNAFFSTAIEDSRQIGIQVFSAQQNHFWGGTIQSAEVASVQTAPSWTAPVASFVPKVSRGKPIAIALAGAVGTKVEGFWFTDEHATRAVVIEGGVGNIITRSIFAKPGQCLYVRSAPSTKLLDLEGEGNVAGGTECIDCFLARTLPAIPCPDFGAFQ